jgi:cobyrinic acid a,c-diamide synthase
MKGLVIAGTHSGSGKTTITLGIMAALKKMGLKVMPFKCGPDFIDPSLHTLVTGVPSRNLDLWMTGKQFSRESYERHSAHGDISVVEGVMGMFDGGESSSGALARELNLPVILVLDVRSMAESAAAILKGFEAYQDGAEVAGVILNMVGSERHLQLVTEAIQTNCQASILGYLPRNIGFSIPSRHLGLHMGDEQPISDENITLLADTIADHIDMAALLQLARLSDTAPRSTAKEKHEPVIRLGVARDQAFCFYYQDNLDILEQLGCEISFFSPLTDNTLPDKLDALYLGGGYPELYGRELSQNQELLAEIFTWCENGKPVYAECGGFMYLTEGITDLEGSFHGLVSFFPARAIMQTKRASLGYREMTTSTDSFWGPAGTLLRGHEFHYSRITSLPADIERVYNINATMTEGYRLKNCLGGYMHLHFGFNREAVKNFIQFCKE